MTVVNPYSAAQPVVPAGEPAAAAPARPNRKFQFAKQGRYVEQGNALRAEQKLEELRQRIAAASKKAGLDSEFDTLERSLRVCSVCSTEFMADKQRQPPPDVEWWDKALLPDGATYDDIDTAMDQITKSEDSLITHLIQHPIPIPAPGDKRQPERALMLTKKEQRKMRRQRRQADLEDKRDRQKMGLLPPDPPKSEQV